MFIVACSRIVCITTKDSAKLLRSLPKCARENVIVVVHIMLQASMPPLQPQPPGPGGIHRDDISAVLKCVGQNNPVSFSNLRLVDRVSLCARLSLCQACLPSRCIKAAHRVLLSPRAGRCLDIAPSAQPQPPGPGGLYRYDISAVVTCVCQSRRVFVHHLRLVYRLSLCGRLSMCQVCLPSRCIQT